MARKNHRSSWLIGAVALLMLAGGGWVVVKRYRQREAERAFRARVSEVAAEWSRARACLTHAAPGGGEDAEALSETMTRARDRSIALAPPGDRHPYRCLDAARQVLEELSSLAMSGGGGAPGGYDVVLDDGGSGTRRPVSAARLRVLAELVLRVDAHIAELWLEHGGEGPPFPDASAPTGPWDEEVLPPFARADDCPTSPVTLSLGADAPREAAAGAGDALRRFRALRDGAVEVRTSDDDAVVATIDAGEGSGPIRRLRACASSSTTHLLVARDAETEWIALDAELGVRTRMPVGGEALAIALRGEDGREAHLACSDDGPSLVYANDGETALFRCSVGSGSCAGPLERPIGSPRLGLARIGGRTALLRHPPESRVAVVEAFDVDSDAPVEPPRVVPTVDDRANPELVSDAESFVLRLCGEELRASASDMRWSARP